MELKSLVAKIHPLHRTLVSDGTDEALRILAEYLPPAADYSVETYEPNTRAWTWRVPERYVVHDAYLETLEGERLIDFLDNPLHLVSYSLPIDRELSWDELKPHLHFSAKRPNAIPWVYKYYERSWGFCLSKEQFDDLPRDMRYHAVIRSEFVTDPDQGLRIGVAVLPPEQAKQAIDSGEFLVCAHICHPNQANDDASGVAVAVEVARRLAKRPLPPGSMSVRFLFCPETIGSVCYLSHHEDLIPRFKGSIFIEMSGNRNTIALQRTRQDTNLMDRVSGYVLRRCAKEFREGAFREIVRNDEMVINGPGVNIPCVSLSRWPYDEHHTSDDNLDIIFEDMLVEKADVVEEIIRIYASNYVPRRTFKGPVFLSGHGLWINPRDNLGLNRALEKLMLCLDGGLSVFEIAEKLNMDYWDIWNYMGEFRTKELIKTCPVPGASHNCE